MRFSPRKSIDDIVGNSQSSQSEKKIQNKRKMKMSAGSGHEYATLT